jgi:hypothetical protein
VQKAEEARPFPVQMPHEDGGATWWADGAAFGPTVTAIVKAMLGY